MLNLSPVLSHYSDDKEVKREIINIQKAARNISKNPRKARAFLAKILKISENS